MPEREYSKKGESMCPKDGWVIFRNSELISGRIGKGVLGGNKVGGSCTGTRLQFVLAAVRQAASFVRMLFKHYWLLYVQ